MSKTIFKNEVFSIVAKNPKAHELYYKGKVISKSEYGYDEFEIKGELENLLNYDASMVFPDIQLNYIHKPSGFFGWEGLVTPSIQGKKVFLEFFFCIDDSILFNADINLLKVLLGAMKLARKAGYQVQIDSIDHLANNRCATIYIHISPKGNMYEHYKTHLDKFRQYFQQVHASLVQNIIKNQ